MKRSDRWMIALLTIAAVQVAACGDDSGTSSNAEPEPARLEDIEGTDLKRVILSASASDRLVIETGTVRAEDLARKRRVGAQVVEKPGTIRQQRNDEFWVRVVLTVGEMETVDLSQPVPVLLLDGGEGASFITEAVEISGDDAESYRAGTVFLAGSSENHGLVPGQAVLVELTLFGGPRILAPYAAVIYDSSGNTWVYTTTENLVFVRHRITIDYIDGDLAVLFDGPPAGTDVVTVGAAELFGVENGIG